MDNEIINGEATEISENVEKVEDEICETLENEVEEDSLEQKEEISSEQEDEVVEDDNRILIFVSTPMANKTKAEIHLILQSAINKLSIEAFGGKELEAIDTYIDEDYEKSLMYMAKSIEMLSKANFAYFCKGWENTRGCKIEHECAVQYKIPIFYE